MLYSKLCNKYGFIYIQPAAESVCSVWGFMSCFSCWNSCATISSNIAFCLFTLVFLYGTSSKYILILFILSAMSSSFSFIFCTTLCFCPLGLLTYRNCDFNPTYLGGAVLDSDNSHGSLYPPITSHKRHVFLLYIFAVRKGFLVIILGTSCTSMGSGFR